MASIPFSSFLSFIFSWAGGHLEEETKRAADDGLKGKNPAKLWEDKTKMDTAQTAESCLLKLLHTQYNKNRFSRFSTVWVSFSPALRRAERALSLSLYGT